MSCPFPQIHDVVERRRSVPDADKQSGCALPTIVLSEARSLSLFLVVRGGIGFLERLGARSTCLTGLWILTLEPERLQNQPVIIRDESGMDSRQTLKLLAVSNIRRRNGLLSSRRST